MRHFRYTTTVEVHVDPVPTSDSVTVAACNGGGQLWVHLRTGGESANDSLRLQTSHTEQPISANLRQQCRGLRRQQLGFVVAGTGKPGVLDEERGNIVNPDDPTNVLGSVITNDDGDVIGYRSDDGTMNAYNVNSTATTRQAWERVADSVSYLRVSMPGLQSGEVI